jgi:hypothetical protein
MQHRQPSFAKSSRFVSTVAVILLVAPLGTRAAEPVAPPANFAMCTGVADPSARLACYDAAAKRAAPAHVPVVAPAEARFGDTGQLPGDAEARRELPSRLEARVKRVASLPNGRYRLTLDNSQVWQTTEANWAVEFNPEDAITISRLPLGGYQIARSGENRSLGVQRTQ